jgi:hypothetical protein
VPLVEVDPDPVIVAPPLPLGPVVVVEVPEVTPLVDTLEPLAVVPVPAAPPAVVSFGL